MYSLTIHFGPNVMVWQFLFKEKLKATDAYILSGCGNPVFEIVDDFGQSGKFSSASMHGALLEDLDLSDEAKIQRSLLAARGQVKANERAKTDPMLRSAMGGAGPSVLTPFGRNGFNG